VITVAAAALVLVSLKNESLMRAQSPRSAAPPNLRLPDESTGIDAIARTLISAFDQADVLALGAEHGQKLDSDVRYGYVADAAHTDGDLYVYFPKQNVLAVGGVVTGQGWPEVDWWTGGWIGGIVGGIQRLQTIANAETRIVPAVGPVLSVADLKTQVEMYARIYDSLSGMMNKGRGTTEAVAAQPAKEFEAKMGNSDVFIRRSFESLWAYLSPDA